MIMLMTMTQKQDRGALKRQADIQMAQHGHGRMSAEKSEQETLKIRGEDVPVEKAIGSDGQVVYAIVLEQAPTDTNPAGQEIIMIMGPQDTFDRKAMDAFLGSIK
jgi:hypothetical protein